MTKINIRKLKETVFAKISKDQALFKLMQTKPDEIELEEAPYFASTLVTLINQSNLSELPAHDDTSVR